MRNHGAFKGTRSFAIIWIGQLVSLLGSQLTGFALGVWVYVETHSVLMLALTQVASQVPYVVLSPLAGVLADRWNRRTAMIVSDFGSGFAVLAAALFYFGGRLQPWMVIPINLWMAIFNSLMWPSYSAAITLLVPKEHYGRASGLMQLGDALPNVAGPAIAGALYVAVRLGNLALIDFATYLFSVILMVLFVRIPDVRRTEEDHSAKRSLWSEMKFGWDYIIERRGLFYLLLFFATINFISGIMWPLINPLILDNWKANVLGYIETAMGAGTLAGTLIMSVWGGGKRRIYTLFGANIIGALFNAAMGLRASIPLLAVCGFGFMLSFPITIASSQAIWQSKVAPEIQGRVFAVRRAIAWSTQIIAPLCAAPLVDSLFKPAMSPGGALVPILGPIFGVGPNRGVGLLISVIGLLLLAASLVGLMSRSIRRIELDLPDHEGVNEPGITG